MTNIALVFKMCYFVPIQKNDLEKVKSNKVQPKCTEHVYENAMSFTLYVNIGPYLAFSFIFWNSLRLEENNFVNVNLLTLELKL